MSNSIVSVSQAADLVRKDRQTLYNHRKLGKLSFVKRSDDSYGVDIAELQRVYGKLHMTADELAASDISASSTPASANSEYVLTLKHELEIMKLKLETAENRIDDLKEAASEKDEIVRLLEHDKTKIQESRNEEIEEHRKREQDQMARMETTKREAKEERNRVEDLGQLVREQGNELAIMKTYYDNRGWLASLFNIKHKPKAEMK